MPPLTPIIVAAGYGSKRRAAQTVVKLPPQFASQHFQYLALSPLANYQPAVMVEFNQDIFTYQASPDVAYLKRDLKALCDDPSSKIVFKLPQSYLDLSPQSILASEVNDLFQEIDAALKSHGGKLVLFIADKNGSTLGSTIQKDLGIDVALDLTTAAKVATGQMISPITVPAVFVGDSI